MQKEITSHIPLLDENGHLSCPGFAKRLYWQYDRNKIRAPHFKIKEWDYYYIINDNFCAALTVADNSYMGLDSISFISFSEECPWEQTVSRMQFFTFGRKNLPPTSEKGDLFSEGKGYMISFRHLGSKRILTFKMDNFLNNRPVEGNITLHCPETESMVIATPFANAPRAFYYNQKINCMPAEGYVSMADTMYYFDKENSFAGLDWGRGVWTYRNTWYWGSASGALDGIPFGFNIGYGFGDTSAASENMIFYDGKAHKISQVSFNIPMKNGREDYMSPWTFTSDDGRFEMDFLPIIDRAAKTDFRLLCSDQHQVFGRFTGRAVLDDGTVINIKDFIGFAEKVYNKW